MLFREEQCTCQQPMPRARLRSFPVDDTSKGDRQAPTLFTPVALGALHLKNRIVMVSDSNFSLGGHTQSDSHCSLLPATIWKHRQHALRCQCLTWSCCCATRRHRLLGAVAVPPVSRTSCPPQLLCAQPMIHALCGSPTKLLWSCELLLKPQASQAVGDVLFSAR